ncbi:MAG: hypothetical protein ACE5PO_09600, partial [Candidatus Bathyarchaeia archaeon]
QTLKVHVEIGEAKTDIEGTPEEVIRALHQFMSNVYPAFTLVKRLTLTVDLERLLTSLEGIIAFTPEGTVALIPKEKLAQLSLWELILLNLTKAFAGHSLGKSSKDSLSVDELLAAIGGRIGAMAGRLSEMVDGEMVARIGRGEYKVTTLGLKQFQDNVIPKLKQLMKGA